MTSSDNPAGSVQFGKFELELASGELRESGASVKLQPKHSQLLMLLVDRAGGVVSREEIRRVLWGDETYVDFDKSINLGINQLRNALGDDSQKPRYIETVPRKGYRFIAPLRELDGTGGARRQPHPRSPTLPRARRVCGQRPLG